MDSFYAIAIKNITLSCKSQTTTDAHLQQQHKDSVEFEDVAPLLDGIEDTTHALTIARWLAEHLQGDENKGRALEVALAMAQHASSHATSQVCIVT